MAKLYFRYGPMNSGKSLFLMSTAYNFKSRGIEFIVMKPTIDTRDKFIKSRAIPEPLNCIPIHENTDFFNDVYLKYPKLQWILIDEAQFLSKKQVNEIAWLVDIWDINVICYGLRTDFKTELFPGSQRLFELADTIEEMKTTCSCGKRALINARIDKDGDIVTSGAQIECGAEDKYITMCRSCYYSKLEEQKAAQAELIVNSTTMENKNKIKNLLVTDNYNQKNDLNISENNISFTKSLNTSDAVYECTSDLNCTYIDMPVLNESYDGCINPWSCPQCGNYVWDGRNSCPQCGAEKP